MPLGVFAIGKNVISQAFALLTASSYLLWLLKYLSNHSRYEDAVSGSKAWLMTFLPLAKTPRGIAVAVRPLQLQQT